MPLSAPLCPQARSPPAFVRTPHGLDRRQKRKPLPNKPLTWAKSAREPRRRKLAVKGNVEGEKVDGRGARMHSGAHVTGRPFACCAPHGRNPDYCWARWQSAVDIHGLRALTDDSLLAQGVANALGSIPVSCHGQQPPARHACYAYLSTAGLPTCGKPLRFDFNYLILRKVFDV